MKTKLWRERIEVAGACCVAIVALLVWSIQDVWREWRGR